MAASASSGPQIPRALIVVVLGLIVIVVVFAVIPFLQQVFSPHATATLSNVQETTSGCGSVVTQQYYTYTWTFTISNTGNTNEDVTVSVVAQGSQYSGASPLTSKVYPVPRAMQLPETLTLNLPSEGCTKVPLGIQITSTKAT